MSDFLNRREAEATQRERRRDEELLKRGELHDVVGGERPAEDPQLPDAFAVWTPEREARRDALGHAVNTRAEGEAADSIVKRAHEYLHFLMGTGAPDDPTA